MNEIIPNQNVNSDYCWVVGLWAISIFFILFYAF